MDPEDRYHQLNEALNPLDDAYQALRALSRMMHDEVPSMSATFQMECTAMLGAIVEGMHAALERLDRHIDRLHPSDLEELPGKTRTDDLDTLVRQLDRELAATPQARAAMAALMLGMAGYLDARIAQEDATATDDAPS